MTLPEPTWRPSSHEYHSVLGRWSSSRLKTFRTDPSLAFSGLRKPEIPSEALVIGSAINALVLDPSGSEIYVSQVETRGNKSYPEAVRAWGHDRLVVTAKEYRLARAGAASILEPQTRAAELAKSLLTQGEGFNEWAYQWEDPETGVPCQAMLDRLTTAGDSLLYVELKSTRDPSREAFTGTRVEDGEVHEQPWRGQARKLGYHCQTAFNLNALRDAVGDDVPLDCFFVAVGNTLPHAVGVYHASVAGAFVTDGEKQIRADLSWLATCIQDDTGAKWHHPWELLANDDVPEIT